MKKLSFKAEEIDNRLYNVEILEKLTAALQLSIDQATKNAATAQNAAKTAEATAKTAEATANTARSTANTASHTANTASATANVASEAAATAKALAEEGKILAEEGKALANTAQSTADTAVSTANTAQSTADAAVSTANTAKATANTASETAAVANKVAEEGKLLAEAGKKLAETADSTATAAAMTAESAKETADTAKSTAETAKSTAETAQGAAATAQSAAEAAQAAAEAAQGAANTAQATADLAATAADLTALQAEVTELSAEVATNTANVAQHTSDVAKLTADIAANTANVAKATADVASLGADVTELQAQMTGEVKEFMDEVTLILEGDGVDTSGLQDNLSRIEEIANKADKKAEEAQGKADSAQTDATQGINDAAAAQKSADEAKASATAANTAATTAQTKAEEAWTHADNAKQAADKAQTSADQATTAAGVAQSKADEAFGHAQDALTASEAAATNANNAAISAAGAEAKANEASIAAGDANKAAGEAEELATKAEAKAAEAEGHASAATEQAVIAQQEAAAAASSAANAASSASTAAENATKAQGFADNAAQLAEQANTKAQEANTHAESALGQAAIAQEEAGKAQKEAEDAQAFATEAEEAAKEARAAADLAQLTADNKSSTFKGAIDPVVAYNNAVLDYISTEAIEKLNSIPACPKVGDLWYEPTQEDAPDKVWQLATAYLDAAKEIKDENDNIINVLYLIYKDADFNELGGIWTDIMVNTITTGFVNALGVTAQKIEVKDSSSNILFSADGSEKATNKVIIGGFGVKSNALHSGLINSMTTVLADGETGVYLGTDGLRIGNKFKVTSDGTVYSSEFKLSQEEIDKLALKVKYILYAKNNSGTVPPENNWTTSLPEAEAGEYVWTKYVYQDTDEDDLNNQYSYQVYRQPENGTPGKDGQDGADGADGKDGADGLTPYIKEGYWWIGDTNTGVMAEPISYSISKNIEFHNGSEQAENLQFIVQKQIGQNEREPNTDVIFRYKFADEPDYTGPIEVNSEGKFVLLKSLFLDKNRQDLTVSIGHWENGLGVDFVEDDVEIINYISKSGYAVILDNDVASLVYNSDGAEKLDGAQSVTATASLYENNKLVESSTPEMLYYEWTLDGLTGNISSTRLAGNNDTITITAIDANRDFGTATCIAVWEDAPQEHKAVTFKVNKNRQGIQGIQGIQGEKGATGEKGSKGDKGDKGDNGTSIGSVVEYYLATSLSAGVTTSASGWTDTVQNVDATKKYLWNYEVIKDSKGNIINSTTPCIIGAYGDKGSQGKAGKGISSITNYYLVSTNNNGIVNTSDDWKTTPQTTDTTNKYLWNYELITYTDGTTNKTDPCIIGTHGETGAAGKNGSNGKDGTSITIKSIQYQAGTSGTTKPISTWSNDPVVVGKGGYLWTKTTYSDNSEVFTAAYQGNDGTNGTSVGVSKIEYKVTDTNSTPTSGWSTTYPTTIGAGKYLWTKTTYTDQQAVYTSSYQGINGINGQNGKDGVDGKDGNNGIDATSYWLSASAFIHRGILQENDIIITAYKKIGNQAETIDNSATIYVNDVNKGTGSITITANTVKSTYKNTDLTVVAKHDSTEFDREVIEKALNTYVLALSNDSSTIKTGETATSNAIVYMDGVDVSSGSSPLETVTFKWTEVGSTSSLSNTSNISINANNISGTKTYNCQATVNGTTLNKQFTVTKVSDGISIKGDKGADGTSAGNLYKLENTGNAPSKPTSISASGWTKAPQEPTASYNYCWVSAYTIDSNGTFTAETPILHASYEGMISLLSDNGLKIIAKDSSTGEYHLKADHLNGALGNSVTVGGFTVNNSYISSDPRITVLANENYDGVYIGTDGISLGKGNFVVKPNGDVTIAGNVTIGRIDTQLSEVSESVEAAWGQAQSAQNAANNASTKATDAQSTADTAKSTATNAENKAKANEQSILTINGAISALQGNFNTLNAEVSNLGNASAKSIRVGTAENWKFVADSTSNEVSIGGFTANTNSLYSSGYISSYTSTPSTDGIYVGTDGIKLGTKFSVSNAGAITAKSGTIGGLTLSASSIASTNGNFSVSSTGSITAKSGTIGGFSLGSSNIHSSGYITSYSSTPSGDGVYVGTEGIKLGTKFSVSKAGSLTANSGAIGGFTIGTDSITSTYSGSVYGIFANGTTYGSSCFQKDGGRVYGTGMIRARTISLGNQSSNYTNYTTGFVNGALQVATNSTDDSSNPQLSTIEPWQLERLVSVSNSGSGAIIATVSNISIAKDSKWTMPKSTYNLTGTTILYAGMTPKADNDNAYARTCHVTWDTTNVYFHNTGDEALEFTCFVIGQKAKTTL